MFENSQKFRMQHIIQCSQAEKVRTSGIKCQFQNGKIWIKDKNAHVIKTLITILNASRATENAGKVKLQRWIMCRVKNVKKYWMSRGIFVCS